MIGFALTVYIIFLLIFSVLSYFAVYQISKFGYEGDLSRRMIVIYLGIAAIIVFLSLVAFFLVIS